MLHYHKKEWVQNVQIFRLNNQSKYFFDFFRHSRLFTEFDSKVVDITDEKWHLLNNWQVFAKGLRSLNLLEIIMGTKKTVKLQRAKFFT